MYSVIKTAVVCGFESLPVQVETDVSDGMPSFDMVGFLTSGSGINPKNYGIKSIVIGKKRLIRGICQMTYIMGILFLILAICNSGVLRKISVITICGFMI